MLVDSYWAGEAISIAELDSVLEQYPWFSAAQAMKACEGGEKKRYGVDAEKIAEVSEGEIITRFLRMNDYRIVADEGEVEGDVCTEADIDDEDDIVSEDLAEIYLAQGLKNEAIEIYRKLSLQNSEKSAYFAEKIENIEKNN